MKLTRQDILSASTGDVFRCNYPYYARCPWFEFKLLNRISYDEQRWHTTVIACDCGVPRNSVHIGGRTMINLGKSENTIVLVKKATPDKHPLLQLRDLLQCVEKEQ